MSGHGSPQKSSISFDRLASVYDATRGGLDRGSALAADLAKWVRGPRVLEIGVGTGAVALPLREEAGLPVLGIDLSPVMLEVARERIGRSLAVGVGERLPLATASVDSAYMVWVLQLVSDVSLVLSEVARVLRPGGLLAIIPAFPFHPDDDEMQPIEGAMFEVLRPRATQQDRPSAVIEAATASCLRLAHDGYTADMQWTLSPVALAERIERRTMAVLLDLDQATFERVALAAAARLRALPDPERPRTRSSKHQLLVFERTG